MDQRVDTADVAAHTGAVPVITSLFPPEPATPAPAAGAPAAGPSRTAERVATLFASGPAYRALESSADPVRASRRAFAL
jgi:hypothetical protein